MSNENDLLGRLDAIEHLLSLCTARLISPQQIESDRSELAETLKTKTFLTPDGELEWVRSKAFCESLDHILELAQQQSR